MEKKKLQFLNKENGLIDRYESWSSIKMTIKDIENMNSDLEKHETLQCKVFS